MAVLDTTGAVAETSETNNAAVAAVPVEVPINLTLTAPVVLLDEGAAPARVRLSRSGGTANAVTVTLASGDISELTVPPTATIPAGYLWVEFDASPVQDSVRDGDQSAVVSARALDAGGQPLPGYSPGTLTLQVLDSATPSLILTLSAGEVSEGGSVVATLSRDLSTFRSEMLVVLSVNADSQLELPGSVTIPASTASTTFTVRAATDGLVELDRTYRITAAGFGSGTADLRVRDTNRRDLAVTAQADLIAENAITALVGTVTRPVVTSRSQAVALRSSDPARLTVPTRVTIPANRASVDFPIYAVDNLVQGDGVNVTVQAFAVDPVDPAGLIPPGGQLRVMVQDNDSPALTVTIDRGLISESAPNPAAQGTVRRNTLDVSTTLVVGLASSDPNEARVGPTVTIPAGSASAPFDINAVDDMVPDGNKVVTISASAPGFNPGSSRLVVSDVDKPDLRATAVTLPANGLTDATVTLTYRRVNEGRQPAAGSWIDRVYLSADTSSTPPTPG